MTVLATPTPYLRDGLRRLVAGLKRDAETVRLNLAVAEQDVAAARALLAEAEAHRDRAKDAADRLAEEIAFFEREAERTPPAYDPDAALAATGLMPREDDGPISATLYQDNGLPMVWDASVPPGGYVCAATDGDGICGRPVESEPCDRPHAHQYVAGIGDPRCLCGNLWPCGGDDDLTAPGVADSRAEVAPHLPVAPPVPHEPAGAPVATSGPLMTMPDLAPQRVQLDPPPGEGVHTHARPNDGLMARVTGGWPVVGRRRKTDEQDGDQADG